MASDSDHLIRIDNLCFSQHGRMICKEMNLRIARGKITAIMGPSGSGKTTLLRLIGGLLAPDSGSIHAFGANVHQLSPRQLAELRRNMGMLFQSNALFTDLSVYDNVAFPLREHTNLDSDLLNDLVLMKLEAVGLRGAAQLMPSSLSGGMARRVALARAMALDPELMMYDEPFTGQDPISMGVLTRLIKRLNDLLNHTSVIVSHDVTEPCASADYLYVIAEGHVIGEGSPAELLASNDPKLSQFMHGESDGAVPFHYPASPYLEELLNA